MYNACCLKWCCPAERETVAIFERGEREEKKRKLQVLKASCVRVLELTKYRSEKNVVKPTPQLLDPCLN